ncbi:MAG TPA: hypothetical protein VFS95_11955 [Telluria sp.]|nr:hypothetical protein [Telluria sp.]
MMLIIYQFFTFCKPIVNSLYVGAARNAIPMLGAPQTIMAPIGAITWAAESQPLAHIAASDLPDQPANVEIFVDDLSATNRAGKSSIVALLSKVRTCKTS